jgi:hypothetical protein
MAFELQLPYAYDALEPHIDAQWKSIIQNITMRIRQI